MRSYNLQKNKSFNSFKPRSHSPNSFVSRGHQPTGNNVSVHSEHLWNMMQEIDLFPEEIHQLLRYEERNLTNYKKMIEREKIKAGQEIEHLKIEILHNIEDMKLSIYAQLDKIYRNYMEKYAILKEQIMAVKKIKDQLEMDVNRRQSTILPSYNANKKDRSEMDPTKYYSTNQGIMKSLQKNNFDIKKYQMLNYIAQLQRQKIIPLNEITRELVTLTHYENGYYQNKEFQNITGNLINEFKASLREIYETQKFQFIRQPESICQKEQEPILNGIYQEQHQSPFYSNNNAIINNMHELKKNQSPALSKLDEPKILGVSNQLQNVYLQWAQNLNLHQHHTIKVASNDIILCSLQVTKNIIAVGNKEGNINIYQVSSGQQIANLKGHKAGVCKLALVVSNGKKFLASGSDYGCSSIVLWDILSWNMRMKIESHKAAISAIVDLNDNRSMISGSYDKNINIYNLNNEGKMLYNLPINKTPVTAILLNCNNSKMISCGLDDSVNVWQIVRDNGNKYVETMFLQRIIQNNTMICSLTASILLPDVVFLGAKDGKIKLINIDRGEAYKTYAIGNNAIVQLVAVERKSKPQYPLIISWSCLEESIKIINTENGTIKSINVKGYIEFGCGIGPKGYFLNNGKHLAMLSQGKERKEINLFKIETN